MRYSNYSDSNLLEWHRKVGLKKCVKSTHQWTDIVICRLDHFTIFVFDIPYLLCDSINIVCVTFTREKEKIQTNLTMKESENAQSIIIQMKEKRQSTMDRVYALYIFK